MGLGLWSGCERVRVRLGVRVRVTSSVPLPPGPLYSRPHKGGAWGVRVHFICVHKLDTALLGLQRDEEDAD